MSTVGLHELARSFGAVVALDGVSLDIADGELLAILGPSGCGKTTLLRLVAGLEAPDSGHVQIGGHDVTGEPPQRRSIGMVFQSYALFPNLTVRQNVAFPLEVRGTARGAVDARVDELLRVVSLDPEADRYPYQISGGQAQRCALARALAPQPDVLLLDEPLSALDVQVRARLRDEIRRIQKEVGTTTLYVTHDQGEALAIADRVSIMNHGRIEQTATPDEIYARPVTPFCAAFVGNRNSVVLPVTGGRVHLGPGLDVAVPGIATRHAQLFVAPEDVSLIDGAQGTPATIVGRTFHGPSTRIHVSCAVAGLDAVTLTAEMSSREARKLADGEQVHMCVDPDRTISFAVIEG